MATLRELGSEPTSAVDARAYLRSATRHLAANNRSLPFTITYLFDEDGNARLASASGITAGHVAAPEVIDPRE